jgi:ferrous iron transport protein A
MMPLIYGKNGEKVKVVKLSGGKNFIDKLASMGIYSGAELKVVKNGHDGPMIVALGNTRIGLGHGMAKKILVKL